jgi:ABC-type uncharacterized transport system involved in gliding motility auxiliary subunit
MAESTRKGGRIDALVMLGAAFGVAILVNALAVQTAVRLDLTEQKVHTLSDASVAAAKDLDDVTVTVYISKKLPDTIPTPQGKVPLKGIDRAFRDKLAEYQRAAGGKMKLVFADDGSPSVGTIEEQGEAAKLDTFSSTEAQVTGSTLKFQKYVLGATFHYKTVSEVLPKALSPGFYEFEMTQILLRLKEKYEQGQLMKEPLAQGKAVFEGVKTCNEAVQKSAKLEEKNDDDAGLSLKGSNDPNQKRLNAMQAAAADLDKACAPIAGLVAGDGAKLKGKNRFGDHLVDNAAEFDKAWQELKRATSGQAPAEGQLPPALMVQQLALLLDQLFHEVDRAHQTLADSPGRKSIGFLCGHDEFCPFAEPSQLVDPQVAAMLGQNNPMMKQIVQAAAQISQVVDETNSKIGDNLFTKRGYSIRRIGADEAVPDDVAALIVYAPRKPLGEFARYQLDQTLLSGKPVVVLAQAWQVALLNLQAPEDLGNEMKMDWSAMFATTSNLDEVLKAYGVELGKDPVLDSKHVETVRVTGLVNKGGLQFQTQQDFPYALIPVATDFDRTHALTRSIANLSLPYTTSVEPSKELAANKNFEVSRVIRSSTSSLKKTGPVPVLPQTLKQMVLDTPPNGPHTLALAVQGPFKSAFAGKEIPHRPDPAADTKDPGKAAQKPSDAEYELAKRTFKAEGKGKLLVIASNLGIEGLSRADVLAGFDMAKLQQFSPESIKMFTQWQANFQNWQIRIGQVSHLLNENLQFLSNILDWASAHEALVAIRSKGDARRPMDDLEPEKQKTLRLSALVGSPLLLILLGILRWRMRVARNRSLKL